MVCLLENFHLYKHLQHRSHSLPTYSRSHTSHPPFGSDDAPSCASLTCCSNLLWRLPQFTALFCSFLDPASYPIREPTSTIIGTPLFPTVEEKAHFGVRKGFIAAMRQLMPDLPGRPRKVGFAGPSRDANSYTLPANAFQRGFQVSWSW